MRGAQLFLDVFNKSIFELVVIIKADDIMSSIEDSHVMINKLNLVKLDKG